MGAFSDDQLDFYQADLGPSLKVALTAVNAYSAKLAPRRYLVQFLGLGANTAWVRTEPFGAAVPAVADAPCTPFFVGGKLAFEINVRPNHNDQFAAIMSAGTGTMIITPISRVPKK